MIDPYHSLLSFRPASIVQGDKHVIHPILEWLLRNMPKLKERAYLANYLVRINVPADFLADAKVSELNEEVTIILFSVIKLILIFLSTAFLQGQTVTAHV